MNSLPSPTLRRLAPAAAGLLMTAMVSLPAADAPSTNAPTGDFLLTGSLGRLVVEPTNDVPPGLLPPAGMGLNSQIPAPARGTRLPEAVRQRLHGARAGQNELQFFPATQPHLSSYLAAQDEYGNTAIRPGALIRTTPLDEWVQQGKYRLSEYGLRYSLAQTFTVVSMSDVMQGDHTLGFYTFDFAGKWAVFSSADSGSAGWVSAQIEAKSGLGAGGQTQSAQGNLGSLTQPAGIWSGVNGFRIPELAWQQSFRHGEVVVLAGMVSQGNYLDVNSYANSGRGQFMNSGLINSMVLPLPGYNPGVNLQWQVHDEWYAMLGSSVGNAQAGQVPWTDFNWNSWSVVAEFGYAPENFLGLGPGVYRLQPFVARVTGMAQTSYTVAIPGTTNTTDVTVNSTTYSPIQAGLCFNLQQQLGQHSPFGWFGRFGFGGQDVTAGASAQVGTGFVMKGPLQHLGLFPSRNNDSMGVGFVWSQPSASSTPALHQNEYVLETGYVLQLSPTARLQPDLQVVWNPAYNPDPGPALVVQLQLEFSW